MNRTRAMTQRLDRIPAPLNPKSKFNGITRPVLIVLMMISRQAARDGIIPAAPSVSIPRQESVRHDSDHSEGEDVVAPRQVEALYRAVPGQWAIMVPLAACRLPLVACRLPLVAWCQLRRGECLGLQRRDIERHDDGSATLHVRRQLNANTGDYTDTRSDAGKRSLTIPKLMTARLKQHLADNVTAEAKAPVVPASVRAGDRG
ncbi:hypothetical protein [Microbacterium tenebrionis]|uniref:hypothetical protein n=1 Tax=Microbacterium tenebrionis TaxID=2830665 RepID=UPI001D0D4DEC|nr:hypothetical protein [Microbacterium tenebrionis]